MNCQEIRIWLNAYLDGELPAGEAEKVKRHLETCPACCRQAEALRRIGSALDRLPPLTAPPGFYRKTLGAYRKGMATPSMAEWWQNLTMVMRSAVCGAALAGLLCGAVMATGLAIPTPKDGDSIYQSLYATSEGFYP